MKKKKKWILAFVLILTIACILGKRVIRYDSKEIKVQNTTIVEENEINRFSPNNNYFENESEKIEESAEITVADNNHAEEKKQNETFSVSESNKKGVTNSFASSKSADLPKEEKITENEKVETSVATNDNVILPSGENTICNDNNDGWIKHISSFKQKNVSSLVFNTKQEATDYGEYAMSIYDYGYWVSNIPNIYKSNECSREYYTVQLYASSICVDSENKLNPMTYLPATKKEKLVSMYDFMESLGYDCSNER